MDNEIWKPVVNYEDSYEVSSLGRVRSVDRHVPTFNGRRFSKGKMKDFKHDKDGYCVVHLYRNQKCDSSYVHRVVAKSFIPNPENKPQVNHIDGIKTNNTIENLEWCTGLENCHHSWKYLNRNNWHMKGELCNFSKLKLENVKFIRANYNKKFLNQKALSKMFNVSNSLISQIIKNKIWQEQK